MKPSHITKSLCFHPTQTITLHSSAIQRRTRLPTTTVHRNVRSSYSQASSTHQHPRIVGLQLSNPNPVATPSIISPHPNQNSNACFPISAVKAPLHNTNTHHAPINQLAPSNPPAPQSSHNSLQNTSHVEPLLSSNPFNPIKPSVSQSKSANPKSNRRPAKQVINLTPKAIEHLSSLLQGPTPRLIRIGVKNKGCAGMAYNLEYVEKPGKFDEVVTTSNDQGNEVKILIDSRALFSIIGSTMDWKETKLGNKFVFDNPNIKEECGCGESFLV